MKPISMKLTIIKPIFPAVALALSLLGCASQPAEPALESEFDQLWQASAENPQVELGTAVLAGELAAQRGMGDEAAHHYARAANLSDDPLTAQRATQLALQAENAALADAAAARWVELDPENAGAFEIAARLALRRADNVRAVDLLRHLLALSQDDEQAGLISVAEILSLEPDISDQALALFDQVTAGRPVSAARAYARGLLAYRVDEQELARAEVNNALALRPEWRPAQLLGLRLHLQAVDLPEAERLIRDMHVEDPRNLELRLSLGSLLLEFEQIDMARREFTSALKIDADNTAALYALGLIEMDLGEYEDAEKHFTLLQNRGERLSDTSYYLGRIAEQRGDILRAMQFYREVRDGRRVIDAAVRQAVIISRQGNMEAARAYLETLRVRFPQQELRLLQIEGELLFRANLDDEAMAIYERGLAQYPEDEDLLYGRAIVHERLGNLAAAEADLRTIVMDSPEDARALNALGYMLTNSGEDYAEAEALIRRALALTPNDPAVIDSLGWVLFRQGDVEQARVYLERAWSELKDPEVAAHLGEVLWLQGEQERARSVWNEALISNPTHRVLRETIQRLDSAI